jgi:hypothetical protein
VNLKDSLNAKTIFKNLFLPHSIYVTFSRKQAIGRKNRSAVARVSGQGRRWLAVKRQLRKVFF